MPLWNRIDSVLFCLKNSLFALQLACHIRSKRNNKNKSHLLCTAHSVCWLFYYGSSSSFQWRLILISSDFAMHTFRSQCTSQLWRRINMYSVKVFRASNSESHNSVLALRVLLPVSSVESSSRRREMEWTRRQQSSSRMNTRASINY